MDIFSGTPCIWIIKNIFLIKFIRVPVTTSLSIFILDSCQRMELKIFLTWLWQRPWYEEDQLQEKDILGTEIGHLMNFCQRSKLMSNYLPTFCSHVPAMKCNKVILLLQLDLVSAILVKLFSLKPTALPLCPLFM